MAGVARAGIGAAMRFAVVLAGAVRKVGMVGASVRARVLALRTFVRRPVRVRRMSVSGRVVRPMLVSVRVPGVPQRDVPVVAAAVAAQVVAAEAVVAAVVATADTSGISPQQH